VGDKAATSQAFGTSSSSPSPAAQKSKSSPSPGGKLESSPSPAKPGSSPAGLVAALVGCNSKWF